jgi:hypothetical protein
MASALFDPSIMRIMAIIVKFEGPAWNPRTCDPARSMLKHGADYDPLNLIGPLVYLEGLYVP